MSMTRQIKVCLLTVAACCAAATSVLTAQAPAATELTVTTTHDTVPDAGLSVPAPDTGRIDPALGSCLAGKTGLARPQLQQSEQGANSFLNGGPFGSPVPPAVLLPAELPFTSDVQVARPCSLRMALHLATLLRNRTVANGSVDTSVRITFGGPEITRGSTIEVTGVDGVFSGGDALALPPLLDAEGVASGAIASPGSLAARAKIEIDGCARLAPEGSDKPCVNLRLPSTLDELLDAPSATSLVPSGLVAGLLIAGPRAHVHGIAFLGGAPAIVTLPTQNTAGVDTNSRLRVTNSYFGMDTEGRLEDDDEQDNASRVAIQLSGDGATIGGPGVVAEGATPTEPERNVFANGEIGVLVAGGSGNAVQGNWFGTDGTGRKPEDPRLGTAVKLTGTREDPDRADDLVLRTGGFQSLGDPAPDDTIPLLNPAQLRGTGNVIGGKLNDAAKGSTAVCDGACNVFASTLGPALDVGGRPLTVTGDQAGASNLGVHGDPPAVSKTEIRGNWLGVDSAGRPAPTGLDEGDAAIVVRNGSFETTIGGADQRAEGNLIANSSGPGVRVTRDAGNGTVIERNFGFANTGMLIDLGDADGSADGPGNDSDRPSGGVPAPQVLDATPNVIQGTAAPRATVHLYLVPDGPGGEHAATRRGHVSDFLARAVARADGSWEVTLPSALSVGRRVTATANTGQGTSELAENRAVVAPPVVPPVERKDPAPVSPPPLPPPPRADRQAPTVVSVLGQKPPAEQRPVTTRLPQALAGRVHDSSGVARVEVALSRLRRGRTCTFLDFRRARFVRRACARPLFARARGISTWSLPLTRRARARLRRGTVYQLYIRSTDRVGNAATRTLRVRFR